jgi:hypothetical protein
MRRREFLQLAAVAALPIPAAPSLLDVAAEHVRLAESEKDRPQLWGRLGGSETERAAARLLARQLDLRGTRLEPATVTGHRPVRWSVRPESGGELTSAIPTPLGARFPPAETRARVAREAVAGQWWLVKGSLSGSVASNSIRDGLFYQRAVEAGCAGLLFSLPGAKHFVAPIDKAFAELDERYPDLRRPIPCFCLGEEDAARISPGVTVTSRVEYHPRFRWEGLNVVAQLGGGGGGKPDVALLAHLDSVFSGAVDNASGLATLVGLARRLKELPASARPADFYFVGLSGHHDGSAGMRAFRDADARRWEALDQLILLEHTDAQPPAQNDRRQAFLGQDGWPELRQALPVLARESRLMTVDPPATDACIGDLHAVCGEKQTFCLIQAPPYYHTEQDTLDKITQAGLERAVDFHLRLLRMIGACRI